MAVTADCINSAHCYEKEQHPVRCKTQIVQLPPAIANVNLDVAQDTPVSHKTPVTR